MKAIILPTTKTSELEPLTSWTPEFLLPVVNKPIVEHLIELLARHHIVDITLILKHMPYETELYFKDGSRWGVHLSYSLLGNYRGITDALGHIDSSKFDETFLCLPADIVTDLDISKFINVQSQGQWDICLANPGVGYDYLDLNEATSEDIQAIGLHPLIMTGEALKFLSKTKTPEASPSDPDLSGRKLKVANPNLFPFICHRITSLTDLYTANRCTLEGDFKSILIPGKKMRTGFWLGRHCRIHPGARLEGPLLVGDHCSIEAETTIGPGSIIGDHVIIDQGASVLDSMVLNHTYVGPHAEIKDTLLKKNWMFQIPSKLHVHLGDDLILGNLDRTILSSKIFRITNLALALAILALSSPLWAVLLIYHLIFSRKKFFLTEKRLRASGQVNLDGKMVPHTFSLFLFNSSNRLIRKIPGLINVIREDMNLVGVSALDEEEFSRLPDAWKDMRTNAPLGLFHLWELEKRDDLEWEEKMSMESYYAAERSIWWDIKIFVRAFFATMRA